MSERTIEQVDGDLAVEAIELTYARRAGGAALVQARKRTDELLDERLQLMPVLPMVPRLPDPAPRADDGRLVHG